LEGSKNTVNPTATLSIACPDRPGLVAKIANFIYSNGGNIIHADRHTDFRAGLFLSRIEWQLEGFNLPRELIEPAFKAIAEPLGAKFQLNFSDTIPRLSIWVSKQDHCLLDLLWRQKAKEYIAEIPLIISNHKDLEPIANRFGIDFCWLNIDKNNREEKALEQIELLRKYNIDLVILAKYMQIVPPAIIQEIKSERIINIHHSFLPAFVGANPYQRAYDRGVKIIGATAHYVTEELDEGPIVEQDVARISHRNDTADLIRKGKDLERMVLARAVRLQNRILVYGNKTVVFD
jgi:formyltetrahydrofolate deformylase